MGHCCAKKQRTPSVYLNNSKHDDIPQSRKNSNQSQEDPHYSKEAYELQEIIMGTFKKNNKNTLKSSQNVSQKFIHDYSEQIVGSDFHPLETALHSENINRFYDNYFIIDKNDSLGSGFKQTLSYTSKLSEEEVLTKREEFWDTRIEGNQMSWQAIRSACEEDDQITGEAIIQAAGLTLVKNSIQLSYDETGQRFCIPVFCINMPKSYQNKRKPTLIENFEEQNLILYLRDKKKVNHKIQISNQCKIEELKMKYLSELNNNNQQAELNQICLFYGGKLLEDNYKIGEYKIMNQFVIQALIKPII